VKLRPWLRKSRIGAVFNTFFLEPFLILKKGRERWRWVLAWWGIFRRSTPNNPIWIHANSMVQVRCAISLVLALPPEVQVMITSFPAGLRMARKALGRRVELAFLPVLFGFAVRGFLRRYSPRLLILIEAVDLRPLICLRIVRQELPTALINGWVNQDWLDKDPFPPLLRKVQVFGVRSENDRELLAGFGIPREHLSVTGELKFDAYVASLPELEAQIRKLAGERPILIAGSTHSPEVPQILDAFERLGGANRAMLVLAPRYEHAAAEKLLRQRGIAFVQRSRFPVSGQPAVVLLDSQGELTPLYRLAAAAFVGNSLPPQLEGHNPIEPARFAIPISIGPNTWNFRLLADLFDRAGAWQRVANAEELADTWAAWLDSPELARQVGQRAADLVEAQRGLAIAKTLELLRPLLDLDDSVATMQSPSAMALLEASRPS
jgi:3-deoxy-D-manno-octulosonic-acid transferase